MTKQNKKYSLSFELANELKNAKEQQSEQRFNVLLAFFLCLFLFITSNAFISFLDQYHLLTDQSFINYSTEYQKALKQAWLIIIVPGMVFSVISYTPPELWNLAVYYNKIYWRDTQQIEEYKKPTFFQIINQNKSVWIDFFYPIAGFAPFDFFDLKNIINNRFEEQFYTRINFIYNRGLIHQYICRFTSTCFFWGISIDLISSGSQLIPLLGFVFTQYSGCSLFRPLFLLLTLSLNILYYVIFTGFLLQLIKQFILVPIFELLSLWESENDLYLRLGVKRITEKIIALEFNNQNEELNFLSFYAVNNLIFEHLQKLITQNRL